MFEWLSHHSSELDPAIGTLAVRLLLACLAGGVVALIARRGVPLQSRNELTLTLVLMSILIAMATQIIGDNIARAFSLVGALSIVRFRTAVPATRDVAFVLAAVVVGMAVGAGQYWVCGMGLVTVAVATLIAGGSWQPNESPPVAVTSGDALWKITIQVALNSSINWNEALAAACDQYSLRAAETARRGGALELVFDCVLREGLTAAELITELNSRPGVESVSARQRKIDA